MFNWYQGCQKENHPHCYINNNELLIQGKMVPSFNGVYTKYSKHFSRNWRLLMLRAKKHNVSGFCDEGAQATTNVIALVILILIWLLVFFWAGCTKKCWVLLMNYVFNPNDYLVLHLTKWQEKTKKYVGKKKEIWIRKKQNKNMSSKVDLVLLIICLR